MDETLTVIARTGQEFSVDLKSTPGSGAIWYYAPLSGAPALAREDRTPDANIGGALLQTFVFRADATGERTLTFELKRSWEKVVRRRVCVTAVVE